MALTKKRPAWAREVGAARATTLANASSLRELLEEAPPLLALEPLRLRAESDAAPMKYLCKVRLAYCELYYFR